MKPFFTELFEYNHYANQEVIKGFLANHNGASEKAISIFSHILNVQQVWNSRLQKGVKPVGAWDLHVISEFEELENNNHNNSIQLINDHQLEDIIDYKNFQGDPYKNTASEILFHIINHSTYHRGQVATDFRQNGLEPVMTDYILYKRKLNK